MDFTGKVAIVTGGASGIGKATVIRLAQLGASTAVVDINSKNAQDVASEVKKRGADAIPVKTDITDFEQTKAMALEVINNFGRIDILVNNAGWEKVQPFMENEPCLWDRIIDINLKGTMYCTHAVLAHMIEQGAGGKIVNVASDAGKVGVKGEAAYSSAKGAVMSFTKTIAREMAEHNIRVNCISPGITDTPLIKEIGKEAPEVIEKTTKIIPLKRLSLPEEQANAIVWLASDEASYITGQVLSVNGGLNM